MPAWVPFIVGVIVGAAVMASGLSVGRASERSARRRSLANSAEALARADAAFGKGRSFKAGPDGVPTEMLDGGE